MSRTRYKKGDWNVIEDIGGKKVKASETFLRWDGMRVLREDYEPRHPQDFIKAISDDPSVPWNRPKGEDTPINTCIVIDGGVIDPTIVIMTDEECDAL